MAMPVHGLSRLEAGADQWWPARALWRHAAPQVRDAYRAEMERTHRARARASYAILCVLGLAGAVLEYHYFPARSVPLLIAILTYAGVCLITISILKRQPAHAVALTVISNNVLTLTNCGYYVAVGGSPEMYVLTLVWFMTALLFFTPGTTTQLLSCVAAVAAAPFGLPEGAAAGAAPGYVVAAVGGVALMTAGRAALIDAQRFAAFHRGEALRRSEANLRGIFENFRRIRQFIRKEDRQFDWVDVNARIRNVAALCEPDARQLGIDLRLDLTPALPPIHGNGIEIEQVLLNLIRNGFEAMQENNDRPKRLAIRSAVTTDGIQVAVSDNGHGMTPNLADRAFEPFFSTKPHGLGLGLGISRSIVEEHGGRLVATVDLDRGTTFNFTLPVERPEA